MVSCSLGRCLPAAKWGHKGVARGVDHRTLRGLAGGLIAVGRIGVGWLPGSAAKKHAKKDTQDARAPGDWALRVERRPPKGHKN